jgi:hypothetical protein
MFRDVQAATPGAPLKSCIHASGKNDQTGGIDEMPYEQSCSHQAKNWFVL